MHDVVCGTRPSLTNMKLLSIFTLYIYSGAVAVGAYSSCCLVATAQVQVNLDTWWVQIRFKMQWFLENNWIFLNTKLVIQILVYQTQRPLWFKSDGSSSSVTAGGFLSCRLGCSVVGKKNVSIPVHLLWILILHKTLSGLCFQMKGSGLVTLKECRTFLCSGHMMHPHVLLIVLTEISRPSQMRMLRTLHVVWRLFIMVIENQLWKLSFTVWRDATCPHRLRW